MGLKLMILLVSTLALVNSSPNMFVTVSGDVNYDGTNPKVFVNIHGQDQSVVSDRERDRFQLTDDGLKNCVRSYKGRRPTDAYVRSPTPWNDLYSSYGWRQVYRHIKPLNSRVLSIVTKQELVSQKAYHNNRDTPATGKASMSRAFENRLTLSWSEGGEFTVGAEVSVSASLKVVDVGASTSISHTKSWGKNDEHSQAMTITDGAELEFVVPPHDSVYVKTEMYKTLVTVRVEYEARLDGDTAVNYHRKFQGHHFYGLDINHVMRSCGLSTELIITEDITLDLITGAKMEIISAPVRSISKSKGVSTDDIEVVEV